MPILTFRCDEELERELERVSNSEKKPKTQIIREALKEYVAKRPRPSGRRSTAYEALKEYIGIWEGPGDLSVDTGTKFRKIMEDVLDEKERTGRL